MTITTIVGVVFLFLFIAYVAQLLFVLSRFRNGHPEKLYMHPIPELWVYVALSLFIPVLVGFLPDLLSHAMDLYIKKNPLSDTETKPPDLTSTVLIIYIGVRFLIAYLVTIITLELALQAQAIQSRHNYSWRGLLITNLGFDIISIIVFQFFKALPESGQDVYVAIFFVICAVPTILTGTLVVCGSYSELTKPANPTESET